MNVGNQPNPTNSDDRLTNNSRENVGRNAQSDYVERTPSFPASQQKNMNDKYLDIKTSGVKAFDEEEKKLRIA